MDTQARLRKQAVDGLLSLRGMDRSQRRDRLKDVAAVLLHLRSMHTGANGLPDWRGRSYDYRSLVRDIYAEAGLSSDPNDKTKAMLRYWLSELLRQRVPADELQAADLKTTPPSSRQVDRNRQQAALAAHVRNLVYTLQREPHYKGTSEDRQVAQEAIQILHSFLRSKTES